MPRLNRKIILYNISEAREQLEEIEAQIDGEKKLSEIAFQIKVEHAYHHLNFAWNARHAPMKRYRNLSKVDFNAWGKFPDEKEIEAYRVSVTKEAEMYEAIANNFLNDALASFRSYKKLADKAMAQVSDEEFFRRIDDESNSIAIIVKHIVGNMFSRWTDFLTTDGEKPDRNRDTEFVILEGATKAELLKRWEEGWQCVFNAIEPLRAEDLARKITIRGQEHTVLEAINRQLTHYPSHIGQIIFLAKHFRASDWKTLSVPKNKSAEFNAYLNEKNKAGEKIDRYDAPQAFTQETSKG